MKRKYNEYTGTILGNVHYVLSKVLYTLVKNWSKNDFLKELKTTEWIVYHIFLCFHSAKYKKLTGGRAPWPSADAVGQYVDRRRSGGSRKRGWVICCRQCHCCCLWGSAWQCHRTLRLPCQTGTNSSDLSHRTWEIWAGEWQESVWRGVLVFFRVPMDRIEINSR